jgi:hypothetical protein
MNLANGKTEGKKHKQKWKKLQVCTKIFRLLQSAKLLFTILLHSDEWPAVAC